MLYFLFGLLVAGISLAVGVAVMTHVVREVWEALTK